METLKKLSEIGKKLEEYQSEALLVIQELNKLGIKDYSQDSHLQSEGTKKFTEIILNMKLNSKGNSGFAK